jgi:hypothetical protein
MEEKSVEMLVKSLILHDFRGRKVALADYREKQNIVLVFNRGFV